MIRFLLASGLLLVAALPLAASRLRHATASHGRLREASSSLAVAPSVFARSAAAGSHGSPMGGGGGAAAGRSQGFDVPYENFPYNGYFTFVRVKFEPTRWGRGPYMWGLDLKWNHDYPTAERNLMTILQHHTTIAPNMGGGNIYGLTEPDLFKYPWAYLCEVGFWYPTEEEAESLRTYLFKGGFLVVDDFIMDWQWENFKEQMERVLPGYDLIQLDVTHPIFDSFFYIETLDFTHPTFPEIKPVYYGVFEDNDPNKRLMVIANYNHDIGDYWEWSGTGWVPIDISNEAFKLGVNYVIYGMTH